MPSPNLSRRAFCALAAAALPSSGRAQRQSFPGKPVRMIVPFSAGALIDTLARLYGGRMSQALGQPFIVENRPGANGVPATQALLALPPDGHQMLFISSAHSVSPLPRDLVLADFDAYIARETEKLGRIVRAGAIKV